MKKLLNKLFLIILLVCIAACAAACKDDGGEPPAEKAPVKLSVIYWDENDGFSRFVQLAESTYRDIDIEVTYIQRHVYDNYQKSLLSHGQGSDLIMMRSKSAMFDSEYLVDLTAQSFVSAYKDSAIDRYSVNGKVYCVPGLEGIEGFLYNKTLFEEKGYSVPTTNEELLELCYSIEYTEDSAGNPVQTGESSIQFSSYAGYEEDVAHYAYALLSTMYLAQDDGYDFLDKFERGEADNQDLAPYMSTYEEMVRLGYINYTTDSALKPDMCYNSLRDRECAIISFNSSALGWFESSVVGDSTDEWGIMPYPCANANNSVYLAEADFLLGANSALLRDRDKLNAAYRVLALMSTDAGQQALAEDEYAIGSYVKGVTIAESELLSDAKHAYRENRLFDASYWGQYELALGEALIRYQRGEITMSQVLDSLDEAKNNSDTDYFRTIGGVVRDLPFVNNEIRTQECALANALTDLMRSYSGCEIALLNAGNIRNSLYEGILTFADLKTVLKYDNYAVTCSIRGSSIVAALENGVALLPEAEGQFLQFSGIRVRYDTSREVGSRVVSVTMSDGTPFDAQRMYTVVTIDYLLGSAGSENNDGFDMLNVYATDIERSADVQDVVRRNEYIRYYVSAAIATAGHTIDGNIDGRLTFAE